MGFWLNADSARTAIEPGRASPWDTAYLGIWWLPGLVSVDVKTSQKIDVANANGQEGAQLNYGGVEPASVVFKITTWSEQQYNDLVLVLVQIDPRKSKRRPPPLQVRHPKTALAGVLEVVVKEIEWFADGTVPQTKVTTIQTIQYLKPRAILPAGVLRLPTAAPTEPTGSPSSDPAKGQP